MSPIGRKIEEAREAASRLGHKLAGFGFRYTMAQTACETCGCTLLVTDYVFGAAVTLRCKRGDEVKPLPIEPAPATGRAKRLPNPAPSPSFDDVPWPVDTLMRDAVVLR